MSIACSVPVVTVAQPERSAKKLSSRNWRMGRSIGNFWTINHPQSCKMFSGSSTFGRSWGRSGYPHEVLPALRFQSDWMRAVLPYADFFLFLIT